MIITTTTAEYRPCYADGKKALFHRWTEEAEIVPPSMLKGGHGGGQLKTTFAIVEYEDGTIAGIAPHKIRFIDDKLKEYDFTIPQREKSCKSCLYREVCQSFKDNICQSCRDRHNEYKMNKDGICDFYKPDAAAALKGGAE